MVLKSTVVKGKKEKHSIKYCFIKNKKHPRKARNKNRIYSVQMGFEKYRGATRRHGKAERSKD